MLSPQERTQRINEWRDHYNKMLKDIGVESPLPKAGQSVGRYRRNACQTFADSYLPQNHQYAKIDYRNLDFDVFKNFEPQLLQHVVVEYQNPNNVPAGSFREIKRQTANGQTYSDFVGQDCFVKFMGRPGRRVASFWTEQGPVAASGRYLR
jgi:hypothetical protein